MSDQARETSPSRPFRQRGRWDRQIEDLIASRGPLGVPLPAYGGRSVPNVAASLVRALGREPAEGTLPPLADEVDPFQGRRAEGPVLLVVVDGLGFDRLADLAERGSAPARAWLAHTRPITTVFPSTTTVALTSLSTASAPARHGLVGHRAYLPRFGAVVELLHMSPLGVAAEEALVGPAWTPELVSGAPTVFRASGVPAVAISRDRFDGHGFTRLLYDGAAYLPYATLSDFAGRLVETLAADSPPPLTLAYWDELDALEHLRGPGSGAVALELEQLGALLTFVARELGPRRARALTVLVTADHGLVPSDPERQLAVDREPAIEALLARPPSGDRRAALLRARPGQADRLAEEVVARLPAGARALDAGRALREGLFGPPPFHPELEERIGDLVVLIPSPGGITYTMPGRAGARRPMLGAHGGLEPAELVVPLVAGSLEDLTLAVGAEPPGPVARRRGRSAGPPKR